jgi:hypothetical protein
MNGLDLMDLVKSCCVLMPNGNYAFTRAGKIRFQEICAEHGIKLTMDDNYEIREFRVSASGDSK